MGHGRRTLELGMEMHLESSSWHASLGQTALGRRYKIETGELTSQWAVRDVIASYAKLWYHNQAPPVLLAARHARLVKVRWCRPPYAPQPQCHTGNP